MEAESPRSERVPPVQGSDGPENVTLSVRNVEVARQLYRAALAVYAHDDAFTVDSTPRQRLDRVRRDRLMYRMLHRFSRAWKMPMPLGARGGKP